MPSYLCAVNYYRKFIWRFAEIVAPLTDLLKAGGWRPPTDATVLDAVDKLKEALISSPVLAYFDVNAVATDLYCDASGGSIGAVLHQTDKDGVDISSWVCRLQFALITAAFDGF